MNTENMIEVTKEQIPLLVAGAYNLSVPIGMGHLHYSPESLTDDEVDSLIDMDNREVVYMDYIKGRQCKFNIFKDKETNKFYINNTWYDHDEYVFGELLDLAGIKI